MCANYNNLFVNFYCLMRYPISAINSSSTDDHLLHTASCENHCLHHLLPVAKSTKYALREVGHRLSLQRVLSELCKKTFINRMIFSRSYCYTVWSAIGIILLSVHPSVCRYVCDAVHCGSQGWCTWL